MSEFETDLFVIGAGLGGGAPRALRWAVARKS